MSDSQPPIIFGSMDRYKSVPCRVTVTLRRQEDGSVRMVAKNPEDEPVLTSKTNNADIEVELLFEHDGCRVYRFHDAGRAIYFVNGGSDVRWNTGKHGREMNSVQTVK